MELSTQEKTILGGDIGGTKTLLGTQAGTNRLELVQHYENRTHEEFSAVLEDYLNRYPALQPNDCILTLAIAGPVSQQRCQMTNLPWLIDAAALKRHFGFHAVYLLNDLAATAWALPDQFEQDALHMLHGNSLDFSQPVAVISIGTGMGEAVLAPSSLGGFQVLATEGGHKQFAPFDLRSARLLEQAFATGLPAVSWENWFSGTGLPQLFSALYPDLEVPANETLAVLARTQPQSPAGQCIALLADGIFAEAGNLALQSLAWGGVVFAGGVVQHIQHLIKDARHQRWFSSKAEYTDRLEQIPLALCTDSQVALKGAIAYSGYRQMN